MPKTISQKMWPQLKNNIMSHGFTIDDINKFILLGSDTWPACKLNKIFLKNKVIPHTSMCICGKENIIKNYYIGLNRNKFVIVGSKCYKCVPFKVDFRTRYTRIN